MGRKKTRTIPRLTLAMFLGAGVFRFTSHPCPKSTNWARPPQNQPKRYFGSRAGASPENLELPCLSDCVAVSAHAVTPPDRNLFEG